MGGHSINAFLRYIDSMRNDQLVNGLPVGKIKSMTTVDLQYNFNLEGMFDGGERTTFSVGLINAFDKRPPAVPTNGGFESRTHDPRGRLLYFRLSTGF